MRTGYYIVMSIAVVVALNAASGIAQIDGQAVSSSQPTTAPDDPAIKIRVAELVGNVKPLTAQYSDTVKNTIRVTDVQIQVAQAQEVALLRALQKAQQEWLVVVLEVQTAKLKPTMPEFDERVTAAAKSVAKAEFARQQLRVDEAVGFQQRQTDSLKVQAAVVKGPLQVVLKEQIALQEEYNTLLRSAMSNRVAERAAEPRMATLQKLMMRNTSKITYLGEIDRLEQRIAKGGAEKDIAAAQKEVELDKQILSTMEAISAAEDKTEDLKKQKAELKK